MKKFLRRTLVATVAIGMLSGPGVAGANSPSPADDEAELLSSAEQVAADLDSETGESVVDTIEAISSVDGLAESVVPPTTTASDGSTTTSSGGETMLVPADASEPVRISSPAGEVTVDLPVPAATESINVDGVSVFPTATGAVTQHANVAGETQTSFILNGPDAPTKYDVTYTSNGGGTLALQDDGSIAMLNPDGSDGGLITAPWAKDANQNPVPTWYTVDGNTVTQHVDTSEVTQWPVVADPSRRPSFWTSLKRYTTCIFGVGIPIGTALVTFQYLGYAGIKHLVWKRMATTVPGSNPALGKVLSGTAKRWGSTTYNNCRSFILYG